MFNPRKLADRDALGRNRARNLSGGIPFPHRLAMEEVRERLAEINREFARAAIVTGCPDHWRAAFPEADILPDDDRLDFARQDLSLAIHAMALHWADDPVGQLVQCRLALKPDGLLLAACFGGETLKELRNCIVEAETRLRGGISPRVLPMGDIRDYGSLLQRAGFALPVADKLTLRTEHASLTELMHELRGMGEANAMADRSRAPVPARLFREAGQLYMERFPASGGGIRATFEIMFLTGWAPAANQQRPLRPGSAISRLSDALSTDEFRLSD